MEERWEGEQKGAGKYVSWETDHQAPEIPLHLPRAADGNHSRSRFMRAHS